MKHNLTLIITSLLSVLLVTVHLTQDTLHARAGTAEAAGSTLAAVPILVVWLYGTLCLPDRRSGCVIMLLGSVVALTMPAFHIGGPQGAMTRPIRVFGEAVVSSGGAFLFFWSLMVLGVTGMFSLLLATRGLWELRSKARSPCDSG